MDSLFIYLFWTTPSGRLDFLMKAWKKSLLCLFPFWYSAVQLTPSQVTLCGWTHSYEPLQWSSREYSPHPPYPPTLWRICSNFRGLVEIDTPALTKWVPVGNALKRQWLLSDAKVSNMVIEGPQTEGKGFCTGLCLGFSARTSWRSTSRLSPIGLINCQRPACKLISIFSAKQISNCRYFSPLIWLIWSSTTIWIWIWIKSIIVTVNILISVL